ncbi:MAG: ferrochelatase [Coriobacteriia bacterium]|nr:ferrochelatase [Coriobacteriia bacterium]
MGDLSKSKTTGVLLVNMGTPDAPEEEAIRRYLAQMLSDPALISCPPFIWKRVLKYCILPKRPKKNVARYQSFWTDDGSPYLLTSLAQGQGLERSLRTKGYDVKVALAMRYGNPSIASRLRAFMEQGLDHVVVLPMFPQETRSCTGSIFTEVNRCLSELKAEGWNPKLDFVRSYFDNPGYIDELVKSVTDHWVPLSMGESRLAISYHSTVMADIEAGDPYRDQVEATSQLMAGKLGLTPDSWKISYQSRFDSRKWLSPLLPSVLESWAEEGIKDVCVVCPGFAADCLETSIEVDVECRQLFLSRAGQGARFTYVPALGASSGYLEALAGVLAPYLG